MAHATEQKIKLLVLYDLLCRLECEYQLTISRDGYDLLLSEIILR